MEYNYYNSECNNAIEDIESLRDLGIILSCNGTYGSHINKVIAKCRQKTGWVNRTFFRNSVEFKRNIWRTYIQSLVDYGSQIWTPVDPGSIAKLEQILKSFSKGIHNLEVFCIEGLYQSGNIKPKLEPPKGNNKSL